MYAFSNENALVLTQTFLSVFGQRAPVIIIIIKVKYPQFIIIIIIIIKVKYPQFIIIIIIIIIKYNLHF